MISHLVIYLYSVSRSTGHILRCITLDDPGMYRVIPRYVPGSYGGVPGSSGGVPGSSGGDLVSYWGHTTTLPVNQLVFKGGNGTNGYSVS